MNTVFDALFYIPRIVKGITAANRFASLQLEPSLCHGRGVLAFNEDPLGRLLSQTVSHDPDLFRS
jgi:hypothetical protein